MFFRKHLLLSIMIIQLSVSGGHKVFKTGKACIQLQELHIALSIKYISVLDYTELFQNKQDDSFLPS